MRSEELGRSVWGGLVVEIMRSSVWRLKRLPVEHNESAVSKAL